jgi:predicted ArsR family transcriptional regulator
MMTNVMTNITSRQRILAYLRQHHGVSAAEISLALGVTPANARHHLSILESDGRVKLLGLRTGLGSGRPVKVFGLGEAVTGDNMDGLAQALLQQLFTTCPVNARDDLIQSLAGRILPPADSGAHITRKLALTIEKLNRLGYTSRWEAHAVAPRIIFESCPYAGLIQKFPELCQMDRSILQQQLGVNVVQTARLEKTTRGTLQCQFAVSR